MIISKNKKRILIVGAILLVSTLNVGTTERPLHTDDVAQGLIQALDSLNTGLVKFKEIKGR